MITTAHRSMFSHDVPPLDVDMDSQSEADTESVVSFDPFSSRTVSSATSFDPEGNSMSSGDSVYSMTSSVRAQSYRHEYGRGLNNYSEVYKLPADDEELVRLDKQHIMLMEILGKYPPPIYEVLADPGTGGEIVTCLDLGCGSGSWIMDVARDFPYSSCVAVDLVPMQVTTMPPNCRSEVDDINLGLQHFYNDFNVVHTRLICSGVKDYAGLIDQCSQTLRMNGLLDLTEFDFCIYGPDKKPVDPRMSSVEPPYLPRWFAFLSMAIQQRGGSVHAANHLHEWVSENPAFGDVVARELFLPTHPFFRPTDHNWRVKNRIGEFMREDVMAFLRSGRPLLLGHGISEALVNELEQGSMQEVHEAKLPFYIRLWNVYARKRR